MSGDHTKYHGTAESSVGVIRMWGEYGIVLFE
jgi:hypothetical protein